MSGLCEHGHGHAPGGVCLVCALEREQDAGEIDRLRTLAAEVYADPDADRTALVPDEVLPPPIRRGFTARLRVVEGEAAWV